MASLLFHPFHPKTAAVLSLPTSKSSLLGHFRAQVIRADSPQRHSEAILGALRPSHARHPNASLRRLEGQGKRFAHGRFSVGSSLRAPFRFRLRPPVPPPPGAPLIVLHDIPTENTSRRGRDQRPLPARPSLELRSSLRARERLAGPSSRRFSPRQSAASRRHISHPALRKPNAPWIGCCARHLGPFFLIGF